MIETLAQDAVGLHGACQDDWELSMLLDYIRPELSDGWIVEIGCDRGGTLWLWRQLTANVVGVTLHTRADGQFSAHGAWVVTGPSADPVTRDQVSRLIAGNCVDLVFVDGGHDYETAKSDIEWSLRLAPHGLVVVHDINRRINHPEIETYIAWAEVTASRPHMTIARRGEASPGVGIIFPAGN
jgi:cephalosporin hydroxylase